MKPMHPELLHAGNKNVERCLLLPLVVVHGGIDKMHSFRIYASAKASIHRCERLELIDR
jgi:hypothetical protein